jgi:succinate dehydrogenase hydrophobic anchor subunit
LAISGFIYALWGISAVSVQIGILVNSFSTYYHGFWLSIFSIIGGILMMIVAFRSSYPLFQLTRIYAINLVFCGVGLIFSVINYTTSPRCMSTPFWYCDDSLSNNLKLMLLIIFILGLIHTIINMIVVSKEHKRALAKFNPNVIDH